MCPAPARPPRPADDASAAEPGIPPVEDPDRHESVEHVDGLGEVRIRPIRPGDKQALQEGLDHLSRGSVYKRFFGPKDQLSEDELAYLTELDFHTHVALVAIHQADGGPRPIGVGRYVLLDEPGPPKAELALTVTDDHQNHGIGTLLFDRLRAMAHEQGIEAFEGTVLGTNRAMRGLLEAHGRVVDETWEGDGVRMTVALGEGGVGQRRG